MPPSPINYATLPNDSFYESPSAPKRASARAKSLKAARAGYGPHCQIVRPPQGGLAFGAIFRGQRSTATFNSEGAARAWLASCDVAGKFRY